MFVHYIVTFNTSVQRECMWFHDVMCCKLVLGFPDYTMAGQDQEKLYTVMTYIGLYDLQYIVQFYKYIK